MSSATITNAGPSLKKGSATTPQATSSSAKVASKKGTNSATATPEASSSSSNATSKKTTKSTTATPQATVTTTTPAPQPSSVTAPSTQFSVPCASPNIPAVPFSVTGNSTIHASGSDSESDTDSVKFIEIQRTKFLAGSVLVSMVILGLVGAVVFLALKLRKREYKVQQDLEGPVDEKNLTKN